MGNRRPAGAVEGSVKSERRVPWCGQDKIVLLPQLQ